MQALDNIIWTALNSRQSHLAVGDGKVKRFMPEVAPFSGFEDGIIDPDALAALLGNGVTALFLAEPWQPRKGWEVLAGAPLIRMVCDNAIPDAKQPAVDIVKMGAAQSAEMIELTTLARPGPFTARTHEMGDYFGIYQDSKLVALAGERMMVPGYTEVSAVCTHPDYTGRGYAAAVMTRVMQGIMARGEKPFLHSRSDNDRAVALYNRLGFQTRWAGYFAVLRCE